MAQGGQRQRRVSQAPHRHDEHNQRDRPDREGDHEPGRQSLIRVDRDHLDGGGQHHAGKCRCQKFGGGVGLVSAAGKQDPDSDSADDAAHRPHHRDPAPTGDLQDPAGDQRHQQVRDGQDRRERRERRGAAVLAGDLGRQIGQAHHEHRGLADVREQEPERGHGHDRGDRDHHAADREQGRREQHDEAGSQPLPHGSGHEDHQEGSDRGDLPRHVRLGVGGVQVGQHVGEDIVEARRHGQQRDPGDRDGSDDPALTGVECPRRRCSAGSHRARLGPPAPTGMRNRATRQQPVSPRRGSSRGPLRQR